jgi:hypothetical protein
MLISKIIIIIMNDKITANIMEMCFNNKKNHFRFSRLDSVLKVLFLLFNFQETTGERILKIYKDLRTKKKIMILC